MRALVSPGCWRPLNGLCRLIGMEFYPIRMPAPKFATEPVNILDEIAPEAGAFYVMDRGYVEFERLYVFTLSAAFFVVRTPSPMS